jgi:hypothetical protein
MLWGQCLKALTDHKKLVRDALGLTCDRVYHWLLILEEYGPKIVYIKGVDNIVTDAISCLEYNEESKIKNLRSTLACYLLVKLFIHYCEITDTKYCGGETSLKQTYSHNVDCDSLLQLTANNEAQNEMYNNVFATISKNEDDIYPPIVADIASEQREDKQYKRYF